MVWTDFFTASLSHDAGLLLLAFILGGIIGLNREQNEHPAGLKTHILVCLGAALITLVDKSIPSSGGRITAQIVTGVGFLGAGTILRDSSGSIVRGLTTAATVWTVAGIGIAAGSGGHFAALAILATCVVLLTLTLVDRLEQVLNKSRLFQEVTFLIATESEPLQRMGDALNSLHELGIRTGKFRFDNVPGGQMVHMSLRLPTASVRDRVKPTLEANPNIVHVEWGPGN